MRHRSSAALTRPGRLTPHTSAPAERARRTLGHSGRSEPRSPSLHYLNITSAPDTLCSSGSLRPAELNSVRPHCPPFSARTNAEPNIGDSHRSLATDGDRPGPPGPPPAAHLHVWTVRLRWHVLQCTLQHQMNLQLHRSETVTCWVL